MWYIFCVLCLGIAVFAILFLLSAKEKSRMADQKAALEKSYESLEHKYDELKDENQELNSLYDQAKQEEEKVRKLAYIDTLTQLPNKDAITEQIESVIKTFRSEENVALMYIDVDSLKEVNDTLGYTYGDELLIDITYRIKQLLTEHDTMARMSGDEFVILTQNIEDLTEYEDKLKKILTVFSFPFSLAEKDCFVTISIGICKFDKELRTAQMVIKNANAAMYEAKQMGRNLYCYFNDEIKERQMEQIQRQTDVRTALEREEFFEVYQPVLDMKQHKIVGFEMLLRWNHPITGVLFPADFLPAAEESGIIIPLGLTFLKKACRNLLEWQKQGYEDLILMVNLSERQLIDPDLIADVEIVLKQIPVNPKHLAFEISEVSFERDEQLIIERIRGLQALGVQVILDQYGRHLAATSWLREYTYDYIKVDRSLVEDITIDESHKQYLYDLTEMAKNQKSKVVYQGVEVPEQLEILEHFPSSLVQGFLFGNPLTSAEVAEYLSTWMK